MRVYIYPWGDALRAIREDGEPLLEVDIEENNIETIVTGIQQTLTSYKDFAWVPKPREHTLVSGLIDLVCARAKAIEAEAIELAEDETLCQTCSHAHVCSAAGETAAIGALITVCPEYTEKQDHAPKED